MDLNDELKKMFRLQNQFSNKIEAFTAIQNKNSAAQVIEKFNEKNHLFLKYYNLQTSNAFLELNKWDKLINQSLIKNSYINKFQLPDYLHVFQKQNNSIFKLFEKQEFIENFIEIFLKENIENFDDEFEPKEAELNVFGEMIRQEAEAQSASSQDSSNFDPTILINGIIRIIFLILWLYVTHLDEFNNFEEAMVFYINSIECKGVTTSVVNLRSQPNISSEVILTIPKDSGLKIYSESQNGWLKVKVNLNGLDFEGYVSETYISKVE